MSTRLQLQDLTVSAGESEILHGVSLQIGAGETHVILGPNGAGKSTLGHAIMGHPQYTVTGGSMTLDGQDLLAMAIHERARAGLFLSFQQPPELPGVSLETLLRAALEARQGRRLRLWDFRQQLGKALEQLDMDPAWAQRDVHVGCSGGEKKKIEMLQLLLLKPTLAILDETDSGLDVDALHIVSRGIAHYREDRDASLILITHTAGLLQDLPLDAVHVLISGNIAAEGAGELVSDILAHGFARYEAAQTGAHT